MYSNTSLITIARVNKYKYSTYMYKSQKEVIQKQKMYWPKTDLNYSRYTLIVFHSTKPTNKNESQAAVTVALLILKQ